MPLTLLLVPAEAWALKPGKHRDLAEKACDAQRLPGAFCRKMGQAVYETDYNEWEDLSAHAQTARGQDHCSAADAAAARVDQLARAMVTDAAARNFEAAAIDLGRAVHTLQDECAHHGMTNEEHAFYSLEQTCDDVDVSPDVQPEAITCARQRTDVVMAAAARALAGTSWGDIDAICQRDAPGGDSSRQEDSCALATLPTPHQACEFLALYKDWDGADSTWNTAVVGPALVGAFTAGLAGEPASRSVCGGDPAAIDPPVLAPAVVNHDVSCGLTDITCLGKVDGDTAVDPYGEDTGGGGCDAGAGHGLALALLALGLVSSRSRSRRT